MVFLGRDRKMKAAFTTMQKPVRINGHLTIGQRCSLPFGNADCEF